MSKTTTGVESLASLHVKPQEMEWKTTKFEGVEMKALFVDNSTGMATVMIKMAPGAILPDHEHVGIEQTYVIEGYLEDKDGPEKGLVVGPGEYVMRPASSRHAAWTPKGSILIGIFTLPNKFYETDGAVVDFLGNDWEKLWGAKIAAE